MRLSATKTLFAILILVGASILTGPSACADEPPELDHVRDLIETGRPDSAVLILDDLLETNLSTTGRVHTLYLLSQAMNRLGRLGEEIKFLVMAREEAAETELNDRITRDYARLLLRTGNYDGCIAVSDPFRLRPPETPYRAEVLSLAADAYYQKQDYRRAFTVYNELTETYPADIPGRRSVARAGMCLHHLGLVGGAIELLNGYLNSDGDSADAADALWYLGLSYEQIDDHRLAAAAFKRLINEYPARGADLDIYYTLGTNLLEADQLNEAEHAFLNFLANADSSHAHFDEAQLNLERIGYRTGRYGSEIGMYESYIAKYPESSLNPSILFDLARYYTVVGNRAQAMEKYLILTSNERYAAHADSAYFLMAALYDRTGDRDRAIETLTGAAASFADTSRIQRYLLETARLTESWERYEAAIAWYDSVYIIPGETGLRVKGLMGIGHILKDRGRWLEAEKVYERIISEFPGHPYEKEVYLALSDIHYLAGNNEQAALAAEKAVKFADPVEKARILLYIAELYEEIDEQHALTLYSLAIDSMTGDPVMNHDALMKYGRLAMRIGQRQQAQQAFAAVIENSADSVTVRQAREYLSTLSSEFPSDRTNR